MASGHQASDDVSETVMKTKTSCVPEYVQSSSTHCWHNGKMFQKSIISKQARALALLFLETNPAEEWDREVGSSGFKLLQLNRPRLF